MQALGGIGYNVRRHRFLRQRWFRLSVIWRVLKKENEVLSFCCCSYVYLLPVSFSRLLVLLSLFMYMSFFFQLLLMECSFSTSFLIQVLLYFSVLVQPFASFFVLVSGTFLNSTLLDVRFLYQFIGRLLPPPLANCHLALICQ